MADFLIYKKPDNEFYKRGDVAEVRQDGFFVKYPPDKNAYLVLHVIDVDYKHVQHYHNPYDVLVNDKWETVFLKRFNIDISGIEDSTETQMNKLNIVDKAWRQ